MNRTKRSTLAASLVCVALLVATATVGAATIKGTAGNDTLRGGARSRQARRQGRKRQALRRGGQRRASRRSRERPARRRPRRRPAHVRRRTRHGSRRRSGQGRSRLRGREGDSEGFPAASSASTAAASTTRRTRYAWLVPGSDAERELRLLHDLARSDAHGIQGQRPPGTVQRRAQLDWRRGFQRQRLDDQDRWKLLGRRHLGRVEHLRRR